MTNPERYPFITVNPELGEAGFRPHLPLRLTYQKRSIQTSALLDTGAMVNVLPYPVGIELGCIWEQQTTALSLTGIAPFPYHTQNQQRQLDIRLVHSTS